MDTNFKLEKKEINYFLLINFGLIAFISIFIFIAKSKLNSNDIILNFAGLFMYIPAFSTIIVLKKISNYSFTSSVEKFLKTFSIITVIKIVVSIGAVFYTSCITISSLIDSIASLYCVGTIFINEDEFKELNLSFSKNLKKVTFVLLIFIVIKLIMLIPCIFMIKVNIVIAFLGLIENFLLGFVLFFGEEFGWRYFLQPRLQENYGKKIGVIICGIIWGVWHIPLCITLYSPKTPIYGIIAQISFCICIGIFIGYAYMKTKNLLAPILIHLVNNVCSAFILDGFESIYTPRLLIENIIFITIVFLPFLFTKEYRSTNTYENI